GRQACVWVGSLEGAQHPAVATREVENLADEEVVRRRAGKLAADGLGGAAPEGGLSGLRSWAARPSRDRALALRPQPPASFTACSIANASVRPVILVTRPLRLITSSVGVWMTLTLRVTVPKAPTSAAFA